MPWFSDTILSDVLALVDLPPDIRQIILFGNNGRIAECGYKQQQIPLRQRLSKRLDRCRAEFGKTLPGNQLRRNEGLLRAIYVGDTLSGLSRSPFAAGSLAVRVGGLNIDQLTRLAIAPIRKFLADLRLSDSYTQIAEQIRKELMPGWAF